MKLNNFLPEVAKNATFRAATIVLVVGSTILTSCKKEDAAEPVAEIQSNAKDENKVSAVLYGQGGDGGYFYQRWGSLHSGGYLTMNGGTGGRFDVSWGGAKDIVCGKGWHTTSQFYYGGSPTPRNYATTVSNTRKVGYNIGSKSGDVDFAGVYGWTSNPTIEYYVVESGTMNDGTQNGTVYADGHTYTVKKNIRNTSPSPTGPQTYLTQYFDYWGGATTGVNRQVDMGPHITNWRNKFGFGTNYMMIFGVEGNGYGNPSGSTGRISATMWANN